MCDDEPLRPTPRSQARRTSPGAGRKYAEMAPLVVTSCQSARTVTPSRSAGAAARSQPRAALGSLASLIGRLSGAVPPGCSSRDCPIWWRCGWQVARFDGHMPPPADRCRPFSTAGGASCTQKRRPQPRVSTFRAARRRRTPPTPLRAETTTLRPSSIRTVPSAPASHRICFAQKGVARGLGVLRAIPPVGNRTLP